MGARFRLTASGLAVTTALCAGAVAGRVVGPLGQEEPAPPTVDVHAAHPAVARAPVGGTHPASGTPPPGTTSPAGVTPAAGGTEGLLASAGGYTFVADSTMLDGALGTPFRFRITDPTGAVVHDDALSNERQMQLVLVSRDLAVYHHLRPRLGPDGTWIVALPALTPGAYRAFAAFTVTGGPALTLGLDLLVQGGALYGPLPPPTGLLAVDGYDVSLTGAPALGDGGDVALTVASGGIPVTDLEPHLGEAGHLIVIRSSDLAFVQVHPADARPGATGPTVRFHVAVDGPGAYRMFFEFAHDGVLHTAAFTAEVPPPPP